MINRKSYFQTLEYLMGFNPVVGIIGPRQVGKTTLVKEYLRSNEGIYLDLELDSDRAKLTEPELYFKSQKGKTIVLDEVQAFEGLFPLIRALVDQDRQLGQFILLGSASPELLRDSSESLAGRIAYLELSPFLLSEVNEQEELWLKGGFPKAFLESGKRSQSWRSNFFKSYIERDLPILGLDTDRRTLETFFRMVAGDNGQVWNASRFARSLGVSSPTVAKYLHWGENTFFLRTLHPYFKNLNKRLTRSPKVYYRDTGVLHNLLSINSLEELMGNSALGFSWEGFVINQVIQSVSSEFQPYFYRTQDGAEIDLLLERGGKPEVGIEIKFSNSPKVEKGFLNSIKALKTKRNYIITPYSDRYPVAPNIEVINLRDFLQENLG